MVNNKRVHNQMEVRISNFRIVIPSSGISISLFIDAYLNLQRTIYPKFGYEIMKGRKAK